MTLEAEVKGGMAVKELPICSAVVRENLGTIQCLIAEIRFATVEFEVEIDSKMIFLSSCFDPRRRPPMADRGASPEITINIPRRGPKR